MKYSIIIPTYNHCDLLKACIESIIAYTDLSDCEIIVVANGCTDGTWDYLTNAELFPGTLVWFAEPKGYTKATNEGIRRATGKYIVLLNNDTVLLPQPKNQWLEILEKPFKICSQRVGVTGPMKEKTEAIDRDFILFFCAMISRECLNEVGLLDEIFSPGYGEDTCFCIEAENKGFLVVQVPEEKKTYYADKRQTGNFPIFHHGNETFRHHPDPDLIHRNNAIIKERYGKKPDIEIVRTKLEGNDLHVTFAFNNENENVKEPFSSEKYGYFMPNQTGGEPPKVSLNAFADDIPEGLFQQGDFKNDIITTNDDPGHKEAKNMFMNSKKDVDAYGFPIERSNTLTDNSWQGIKHENYDSSKSHLKSATIEDIKEFSKKYPDNKIAKDALAFNEKSSEWKIELDSKDFKESKNKYYRENPKSNFTLTELNIERAKTIDGFMGDEELLYLAKLASTAKVFIEIGSWHGKSSRAIADNLPEGGVLYCIDTWKGSENEQETHHASAKLMNGDNAFIWFLQSCLDLIKDGKIIPLRLSSLNASNFLYLEKMEADVIFIDANHTYEEVKQDIQTWRGILKKEGTICGHDYGTSNPELDGVTKAVNEIFPDVQIEPFTSIWVKDFSKKAQEPLTALDRIYENTQAHFTKPKEKREPCVFDCLPFNNELDILEIRLNELYDVVDRFIIVEAKETHSGKPKELVFDANTKRFEKFLHKITYKVIEKFPDYSHLSWNDANWSREQYQRNYILEALRDCQDNDFVIISDADEIPKASTVKMITQGSIANEYALQMDLYYYNFNTKAADKWEEAKIATYEVVKKKSPCGLRYSNESLIMADGGFHFSYFGNIKDIIKKIENTAHQEYNQPAFKDPIEIAYRVSKGSDIFGRPLEFEKINRLEVGYNDLPVFVQCKITKANW